MGGDGEWMMEIMKTEGKLGFLVVAHAAMTLLGSTFAWCRLLTAVYSFSTHFLRLLGPCGPAARARGHNTELRSTLSAVPATGAP